MTLEEIRILVRRKLYELDATGVPTADLFVDDHIDVNINAELRILPSKNVYLEELWTAPKIVGQLDYVLPDGTIKVEKVEENIGTSTDPDWSEIKGGDTYGGALYLPTKPQNTDDLRVHIKKKFTALEEDDDECELPDEKIDLLVLGASLKCYQDLMGMLLDSKNYDSIVKPDASSMRDLQNWYRDLKVEYIDLLRTIRISPRPREIDLCS